jgi:hypothetical protein
MPCCGFCNHLFGDEVNYEEKLILAPVCKEIRIRRSVVKDYMYARRGPGGSFGSKDSAGRELDAAGKLKRQTARPDLKDKDFIDPDRKPEFKSV